MKKVLLILLLVFASFVQADDNIKKGKELFISKSCSLCHQTEESVPCPAGDALKSPKFMGDFWGKKREVHIGIGGPIKEVVLDEEYFLESIEKPFAKIVKGTLPGMAPLPTTNDERKAIMAYVKSLNKTSK